MQNVVIQAANLLRPEFENISEEVAPKVKKAAVQGVEGTSVLRNLLLNRNITAKPELVVNDVVFNPREISGRSTPIEIIDLCTPSSNFDSNIVLDLPSQNFAHLMQTPNSNISGINLISSADRSQVVNDFLGDVDVELSLSDNTTSGNNISGSSASHISASISDDDVPPTTSPELFIDCSSVEAVVGAGSSSISASVREGSAPAISPELFDDSSNDLFAGEAVVATETSPIAASVREDNVPTAPSSNPFPDDFFDEEVVGVIERQVSCVQHQEAESQQLINKLNSIDKKLVRFQKIIDHKQSLLGSSSGNLINDLIVVEQRRLQTVQLKIRLLKVLRCKHNLLRRLSRSTGE